MTGCSIVALCSIFSFSNDRKKNCVVFSEFKETAERVHSQYKTEKQKRKETELKLNGLEEELQDVKTEKDSMERVRSFLRL